ncbi:MAG: hypothetical protein ACJASB_003423 [Shewanella psychromarinicola]|jgi:hypothetical protein
MQKKDKKDKKEILEVVNYCKCLTMLNIFKSIAGT